MEFAYWDFSSPVFREAHFPGHRVPVDVFARNNLRLAAVLLAEVLLEDDCRRSSSHLPSGLSINYIQFAHFDEIQVAHFD